MILELNMAKRKKKKAKKKVEKVSLFEELREETVHGIVAVLFFVLAIFFALAGLNLAGVAGELVFKSLSFVFGIGYILVPLLFATLAISFFRTFESYMNTPKIASAVIFFLSGLGIIELLLPNKGGVLGALISSSLVAIVDFWITLIILLALLIVSTLVIFDTHLNINFRDLFSRREVEEDEEEYEEEYEEEEEDIFEEEEECEDEEEVPEKKKSKFGKILNFSDNEDEEGDINYEQTFGDYSPPPLSILEKDRGKPGVGDTKANANIIKRTLQNFGIQVEMDEISVGPTVTRYALKPAEGVRISKIVGLQNNLELALAAHPVRIEAPIPGKSLVGIEVPNTSKTTLGLASLLGSGEFKKSTKTLNVALGRDITGVAHYTNIAKMPHVLIAGATGSGKSVTIHALITSLLYKNGPENMRLMMIDPKRVELTLYNKIPHLLTPVITDAKKAILALKWAAKEMDRRYDILESEAVRDISSYHENILAPALENEEEDNPERMPYIVIVIDELADIMQAYPRELESAIVRLAQMSRAVGIHLVLSTQRPSVNVITGLIKANIPARIALQVSSQIDSRTILDTGGAEKLLGAGDMLYLSGEMSKPRRIQAPFISEKEVKSIVSFISKNNDYGIEAELDLSGKQNDNSIFSATINDEEDDDELYEEAKETVIEAGKASTSYLQRKLRVGYSRAARLMDMLEDRSVISPADGSKPREILGGVDEEELEESEEYEEE